MLLRPTRLGSVVVSFALGCGGGGGHNEGVDAHSGGTVDAVGTHADAPPNPTGLVTVPLQTQGGLAYTAPLVFGAQTFNVIVDTGSSSTGVADKTCTSCSVDSAYTPTSSATDTHETASSTYGDGTSWKGEVYSDTAAIGTGYAVKLDFAAITSSNGFFRGGFDGIVGLGPDALLLPHTTSYIDAAVTAGMLPQFAFELCDDGGTMWLGGFDNAAVTSAPVFTPVIADAGYYEVGISGMQVGTTDLGLTSSSFGGTVVDTGTSISFISSTVENAIIAKVMASSGYTSMFGTQTLSDGGCVNATGGATADQVDAALPALGLSFSGGSAAVPVAPTRSYLFDEGGGTYCFAFEDADQLGGMSLIGDTLLVGLVTVFDVGNNTIGFAKEKGCSTPAKHEALVKSGSADHPWWLDDPRVHVPAMARAKFAR